MAISSSSRPERIVRSGRLFRLALALAFSSATFTLPVIVRAAGLSRAIAEGLTGTALPVQHSVGPTAPGGSPAGRLLRTRQGP